MRLFPGNSDYLKLTIKTITYTSQQTREGSGNYKKQQKDGSEGSPIQKHKLTWSEMRFRFVTQDS